VKKDILTIDGSNAISYLINTVLGKDFHVISVQSCTDAISHLQSDCSKDVVILDIADVSSENMDLLEHFYTSAVFKNIKTVVISNSNDESLKDKTVQLGASLFLTKPFDPVHLSEMVKNMVNSTELIPVKKRKNNFNLNIF
jgi:two-component system chemotaxis response regulator CheY